ncbi:HD-GYP domain-containing protein [Salipaludibacillus daqingensis]|uniref:HD-GYP domain-containing protein n=1 Tax=Salipaludibacillus daqingensis TaxID=3041001 RepID=UPI002474774C|nr:HD-GYP domain-containing protein [Salipaludibacillus daqingensis]
MELCDRGKWNHSIVGRSLANDVVSASGHFLLRKGTVLTHWHLTILKNHQIDNIELQPQLESPIEEQTKQIFAFKKEISAQYNENLIEVKRLFHEAISREVPQLQEFMVPFKPLLEKVLHGPNIFLELRHIKGHDEYTYRHSINVGLMSATIGKILRLPFSDTIKLGEIGFLHDIGKMKVPLHILNKETKLTVEEFAEVKKHPSYGKDILQQMEGIDESILNGTLCHHERLDGSGYPFGLKENIPFLTQIIAVADTYDAISSERVYRQKLLPFDALDELIQEVYRGKLNGEIVFPFVEHILSGYIGHEIELDDGRRAKIVQLFKEEINRPLIELDSMFIDMRENRMLNIKEVFLYHDSIL